jgi:hypothetical protein
MLPNMKEKNGTHCGYYGMKAIPNYGRYTKPKNGWCSNCLHCNTEFCNVSGNCRGYKGQAPTGYTPLNKEDI